MRPLGRRPGIHTHGALGPWAFAQIIRSKARPSFQFFRECASRTRGVGYGFRARRFAAPRNDEEWSCDYAPGRSRMRLATMPSITSDVPPSIELALVRSHARGRAPPAERFAFPFQRIDTARRHQDLVGGAC